MRRYVGDYMVGSEEISPGVKKEAGSRYSEGGGFFRRDAVENGKDGFADMLNCGLVHGWIGMNIPVPGELYPIFFPRSNYRRECFRQIG